ncbi:MAG: DUF2500 domain-containing protein [Peptostreptococcaceae bacterium]
MGFDTFGSPFGFDMFSFFFFAIFAIVIITFIVNIGKSISEWSNNNSQPILDVECKVVSKRSSVSHHAGHTSGDGIHHAGHTSTTYYVTFQFESGDRLELNVSGKNYGMICENDFGKLKFQGTRFIEFNRNIKN